MSELAEVEQPELTGFRVALANFDGPFDLLLQLIHSQKMDITEVPGENIHMVPKGCMNDGHD